jgi:hypothetical protein
MGARPADVRLVPPALKIGASLFVILALAGCGAASEETAEQQSDTIVQVERPDPFGPLPTDACFLGIRKYDLQLLAESPRGDALCTELDDRYLETDERLPWPPPDPVHRELFNASRCILEREQEFISVAAADDGWAVDRADTICEGLEGRGWTSYDHLPDEESTDEDTGSCVVASRDLEVALVAWPADNRRPCDELDARYLGGEGRGWPPTAESGLPTAACLATRGERNVNVMATDEGSGRLTSICRALERDGWNIKGLVLPTDG